MLRHGSQRLLRKWCDKLLFCLLFLLCSVSASAASGQYRFDSWTIDNGLPQNSVLTILQTRDGYLWFTTSDGLVRFDGLRLTVFNRGNTTGITSNRFTCLFEDETGTLWIGTEDGGLIRHRSAVFTPFTMNDGLPSNWVKAIRSEGGGLLIATQASLILYYDEKFIPYVPKHGEPQSCFGYRDHSGALWYFDTGGLHRVKDGAKTSYFAPGTLSLADISAVFPHVYEGIYEDREHSLWIATINKGLFRLKDGAFTVFTEKDGLPRSLRTVFEDHQRTLWIGARGGGLVRFRDGRFNTHTTEDGLSGNNILNIYEDREGTLWIGTIDGGLNRLTRRIITFYNKVDGLCLNNIYPIYEDKTGNTWIGTWEDGLSRYREGAFTCYSQHEALLDKKITSLAEDRDGRLWIGLIGGVAYLKDGKITDISKRLDLSKTNVRAIHQDQTGAMWFGTESHGLFRYKDETVTVYTTKDGLAGNAIKAIIEDRNRNLWIATYGGISRFNDGQFTSWTEQDGLASNRVRSLYEDREGILWIGTYDGGLSRFKDGKIDSFSTNDGLFNNGVFQIIEDNHGNFWMSCNLGLYRVSRDQLNDFAEGRISALACVGYGREDGLFNIECNGGSQPAGVKTRDGKLWFPTQGGVAVVDPDSIALNPEPPPVVIEACMLDRRALDLNTPIEIRPDQQGIEIRYTALSFIKSGQIRFKCKLEGLDDNWVDTGTLRTAYYSYLPPGSYTFRVIASNADGVWNLEGTSIQFRVIPPFYRTWWFITLLTVVALGLGVLVYEWRIFHLKRAKSAQEQFSKRLIDFQENERKRIAAELHDSIGQSLAIIKNRALFGSNAPTDNEVAKLQFNQISEQTTQAIEEVKEISYNLRPYLLDRLGLTKALNSMLNKVSTSSGIRFDTDIDQLDGLLSKDEEISLYRIVQESVNNIIKHSEATEAMVVIKHEDQKLAITIQDNGKGFTLEQGDGGQPTQRGFGLISVAERARILGARQEIYSEPGRGTTVTLKLNLKDGHREKA